MYEPSKVWLSTDLGGQRWLTDQFVLYDVTDADVLYCYDTSYDVVWPDGPYQLMATGEWRIQTRDSIPEPDIETYFELMNAQEWSPCRPSEWSVAEHPGRAMAWTANGRPCLLGEPTWTAIRRYHPEATVEWAPNEGAGTFRFREVQHDGCDEDDEVYCGHRPIVFAFAAGIRVPEGQEEIAREIARLTA